MNSPTVTGSARTRVSAPSDRTSPADGARALRLIAVVPALNESERIASVIRGSLPYVEEVVVIDDGSTDQTAEVARAAGAHVLRHERNLCKTRALQTGFDYALEQGYDVVFTLDGDAQHRPDEIPVLFDALESTGADVVSGDRMTGERNMPGSRRFVNRFSSQVASWITSSRILDCHCGFRAVRVPVLEKVRLRQPRFGGDAELVMWTCIRGFKLEHAQITSVYGNQESGIRPVLDTLNILSLALRGFLARIYWDLRS